MIPRRIGTGLVLLAAAAVARAGEPVELRTLFAGELPRPAPPLALALRGQAEVEALARRVTLPAPVLEGLRALDFSRGVVIAVTGDPGVRVVSAWCEPAARSLEVVATRSAPQGAVAAAHLVHLGGQRGLTHGVGRGGPADGPLGGSTDPWAGWTIDIAVGERWAPRTLAGTLHLEGAPVLRTVEGEEWRVDLDPRLPDLLPPSARTWRPGQGIPVELEGEVDHTVWMVRDVRRVVFQGTPWSAALAEARGRASRQAATEPGSDARDLLVLCDASRLALVGWEAPPRETAVELRGFLLLQAGSPDRRLLVLQANPGGTAPPGRPDLVVDGQVIVQREPSGRGPVDRPLGEEE